MLKSVKSGRWIIVSGIIIAVISAIVALVGQIEMSANERELREFFGDEMAFLHHVSMFYLSGEQMRNFAGVGIAVGVLIIIIAVKKTGLKSVFNPKLKAKSETKPVSEPKPSPVSVRLKTRKSKPLKISPKPIVQPSLNKRKICNNCGFSNEASDSYCGGCGGPM